MEQLVGRTRTNNTKARYQRLHEILEQLQGDGLRLNLASRFPRYLAMIREFVDAGQPYTKYSESQRRELSVALCESGELLDALELLVAKPITQGFMPVLRKAVTAPLVPSEGDADAARAAQFELVVAAACRKTGKWPVIEEPDIRVQVKKRKVAIAAKRLVSVAALEKRVKEARDQICRAIGDDKTQVGIIAIDLTPVMGLDSKTTVVSGRRELLEMLRKTAIEIAHLGSRVGELASKYGSVEVVAVYTRFTALTASEGRFANVRPWHCGPVPAGAQPSKGIRRFVMKWGLLSP
jgi:hypothetical protein